jgi:hypothetical protein
MLTHKHIGAAAIATVIATAMVIDTADARGRWGGGGARASGLVEEPESRMRGSVARLQPYPQSINSRQARLSAWLGLGRRLGRARLGCSGGRCSGSRNGVGVCKLGLL